MWYDLLKNPTVGAAVVCPHDDGAMILFSLSLLCVYVRISAYGGMTHAARGDQKGISSLHSTRWGTAAASVVGCLCCAQKGTLTGM